MTPEQRLQIVQIYYQNQCSVRQTYRALREFYGAHNRPTERGIRRVIDKFLTQFTLLDIKPKTRQKSVRSQENIDAVAASVDEDPNLSIRRRSQEVGLCYSTT